LPSIDRLASEYRARGLEILLVNMAEDKAHVQATVKGRGYRARVALDADRTVSGEYGVRGTPTVFLVNRRGALVGRAIGARDWSGPAARAVIEALLAERP